MLKASFVKYPLQFIKPSGTSRGILTTKESYFLKIWDAEKPDLFGIGEASIIEGLSIDKSELISEQLDLLCQNINSPIEELLDQNRSFPSIIMALEMALLDLRNGGKQIWFNSPIVKHNLPVRINGLIWMGSQKEMLDQIERKLALGFSCLKLKIGAIDFNSELEVLISIRSNFDEHELEIRVDANGAFSAKEALSKLDALSKFDLHSIEQPIKQGQWDNMAELCLRSPLPIALDEELIGLSSVEEKTRCLEIINPQYIILKPSLVGGFNSTTEWIEAAGKMSIPWWITSALESNIGLAAITQFTSQFYNPLPQGLGTGQLYSNNVESPLELQGENLFYNLNNTWDLSKL